MPRHAVGFHAHLFRADATAGNAGVPVQMQDVSLGGARFTCNEAITPGTIWRLRFEAADRQQHEVSLLIRSCTARGDGTFEVGGGHVLDMSTLAATGVDAQTISTAVQTLARDGGRPAWELRRGLVAAEPIAVATLSAMSVCARNDLTVSEGILDCTLDVAGRLIAPEASLVGGCSHVLRSVSIGELGSADKTPTVLVLGQSQETNAILDATHGALAARATAIKAKQATIAELGSRPANALTHADRETLTVLMSELPSLIESHATMEANARRIAERTAGVREVRLNVARAIHAGVTVVADSIRIQFTNRLAGPLSLTLSPENALSITSPSDASPIPITKCASVTKLAA